MNLGWFAKEKNWRNSFDTHILVCHTAHCQYGQSWALAVFQFFFSKEKSAFLIPLQSDFDWGVAY